MNPKEQLLDLERHLKKAIETMPDDQVRQMLSDYTITLLLIEMCLGSFGQLHYAEIPEIVGEKLTELEALKKQFANQLQPQNKHLH